MRRIALTQGKFALVDDEDWEWLSQWRWYSLGEYACRKNKGRNKGTEAMHRMILGLKKGDGILTDHRDGNGLNNQRSNLRKCTKSENFFNKGKPKHASGKKSSSKFKGVYWNKEHQKWRADIICNGKYYYLGYFKSERAAARAYDAKAKELHKEFALLNFR